MGKKDYWFRYMIRYFSLFISNVILIVIIYFYYISFENGQILKKELGRKYIFYIYPGLGIYTTYSSKRKFIKEDIKRYLYELTDIDEDIIYIFYSSTIISLFLYFSYLALFFYAIFDEFFILIIFLLLAFLLPKYIDEEIRIRYRKRKKDMINDLLIFITRLSILIESGMTIRDSFNYSKDIRESAFFNLINKSQIQMDNGIHYKEAILSIYKKARFDEIKKLVNILIQGIDKGVDSTYQLKELREDIKRERLINIKIEASKISEKLLIPNILIFIAILILILVPAFLNM